jgi:hypothetical protein
VTDLAVVATAGLGAFAVWFIGSRVARKRPTGLSLTVPPGAVLRLVGPGGAHRCHLLDGGPAGWRVSAPLRADVYVPLRAGDRIWVQAPCEDGLLGFWTIVRSRCASDHSLILDPPRRWKTMERRSEPRLAMPPDTSVEVNGAQGTLIDLSAGGAKVETMARLEPGDPVTLALPKGMGEVSGWALEVTMVGRTRQSRVVFERPFAALRSAARRLT